MCFWFLSISAVSRTKKKKIKEIKNYGQKITIHTSTNKSHKDQLLTTESPFNTNTPSSESYRKTQSLSWEPFPIGQIFAMLYVYRIKQPRLGIQ
jgi:hypothetical protein